MSKKEAKHLLGIGSTISNDNREGKVIAIKNIEGPVIVVKWNDGHITELDGKTIEKFL